MSESSRAIRHFGLFRPGVTKEQALMDRYILIRSFRRGSQTEGKLANWCGYNLQEEVWIEAMGRLESYGLIEFGKAAYGNARTVRLTKDGAGWAMDLTCEAQIQEQDDQRKDFKDADNARLREMGLNR